MWENLKSDTCFDFILYVPVNTFFKLCQDRFSWVEPDLSMDKCFLLKDTMQWRRWCSNSHPISLESSILPIGHCALYCYLHPSNYTMEIQSFCIIGLEFPLVNKVFDAICRDMPITKRQKLKWSTVPSLKACHVSSYTPLLFHFQSFSVHMT